MYNFNAASMRLSLSVIRAAMRDGAGIVKAVLPTPQAASWESFCVEVGALEFDATQFPELKPQAVGGIPLEIDDSIPESEVHFIGADGELVARIECLAIPINFASNSSRRDGLR
jgi:hypothetical protein